MPNMIIFRRPDGFDFLDMWQGWIRHLTSPEHSKSPSEGCPRIGDAHPVVIPGFAPWKQISSLLTLASTQHGNTLRIENTGSTSWKPLRSSSGLARDDDDDFWHGCTWACLIFFVKLKTDNQLIGFEAESDWNVVRHSTKCQWSGDWQMVSSP